jgi:hypothetical protein
MKLLAFLTSPPAHALSMLTLRKCPYPINLTMTTSKNRNCNTTPVSRNRQVFRNNCTQIKECVPLYFKII